MFLYSFEKMIIDKLVKYNFENKFEMPSSELLKVALKFQDKSLFEHSMAKGLESATGSSSCSYGFLIGGKDLNMEAKKEIRALMDQYKVREYKETILLDNFDKIAKIIADANYDGDVFKAQLLIIYDVCIRKEIDQLQNNTQIN
jgi:hypothetical protein